MVRRPPICDATNDNTACMTDQVTNIVLKEEDIVLLHDIIFEIMPADFVLVMS